ncbi:MAG: DUF5703 domain-containing protein [Phycisphaerales bacterium]
MNLALVLAIALPSQVFDPIGATKDYDVVWTSPSQNASGSMPLGNGRFGGNFWVEENGDLCVYLSHTDAWSEANRLLKLGKVRLSLDPPLVAPGVSFEQRLDLASGAIKISAGDVRLAIAFDPEADILQFAGDARGRRVTVSYETWRTRDHDLCADKSEGKSSWTMHSAPDGVTAVESADAPIESSEALIWRHRNARSIVPLTLRHQGLESAASEFGDPLINRTFGVKVFSPQLRRRDANTLRAEQAVGEFEVVVAAACAQTPTDQAWLESMPVAKTDHFERAAADARRRWSGSYMFVQGDPAGPALPRNTHPLRIGADSNNQNRIDADLRRVVIRDGALAAEAVRRSAAAQGDLKVQSQGVIAAWSAGTSAGEALTDLGAGGHAMKRIGTLPLVEGEDAVRLGQGRLETASHESLDLSSDRTIEVIVRPRSSGRLLDKLTAGTSDGFLFDIQDGRLRLIAGTETIHATKPIRMGEWVHLAAVIGVKSGRREIYVNGELAASSGSDQTPSMVTRAYVLSRFMTGSADRGEFPIKFNGSIFTVEPSFTSGAPYNADFRNWGGDFWWQNTRLSYEPMLARGEWASMDSLFKMYERVLPGCVARTKLYYGAEGVYFPETMTTFGTYSNGDYGWNREGAKPGDIHCPWWQWVWQQSLELSDLMLRRYEYSGDREFLERRALPMVRQTLAYFDSRFARDANGLLRITPTQAIETFWEGVVNDTPTVAGLHAVLARLDVLPPDVGSPADRAVWARLRAALPPVPTRTVDGVNLLAPAAEYVDKQSNVENPELYAVHPFGIYGVGRPGHEVAQASFPRRTHKNTVGWTQDGMVAAMLGLPDEAGANIVAKARNSHRNHRFPAMWGPNFDWLPDQCHNGNITNVLQLMALQSVNGKLHVLPAWPKNWDVTFKLFAERGTIVECEYRGGRVVRLQVTPESRRKDVVMAQE